MDVLRAVLVQDMARALLLAAAAFVLTLFVGAWWVRFARRHKLGKQIRLDGPQSHLTKMGTPTMGGVMIVGTVVVLTALVNVVDRWSILLPLAVLVSFAVLGGVDDWMTLTGSKSKTYGFTVRYKFWLMILVALVASLALYLPPPFGLDHEGLVQIPFVGQRDIGLFFIPIATLIIVGTANAVNLTDGLDSLAGWNLTLAFAAYGVMTFLAEPQLINLMGFCFTLVGACAAFLWFNAHPAQVFMGDLGSLALGATLAVVALQSQQWLLLPVVGIVFVVEALSVIIQTGYFKWTKWRFGEGRRVFRMAPLHHHFELLGWSQVQVTQRFVLIGTVAAMVGISLALIFTAPSTPIRADLPPASQVVEGQP
ncbi:phospho-N-acetylmuramoyl-pentapeptide-transferase [Candidatus Chloroploca sp. M-50]|uniref:Phospho-N-acetylmuramoyl-pentapeptide-transferase n=1 Tax=Candidatus Chloroploca mongolica TaxID=2528176 RepID=A0ABS4D568_9CHLR|nr:phospho-N-acetylmuramoyl-pentapeptide-transferase [Candidatus Chloroploca mongolica]MBP1464582.1 phospho-N-acetylmuramoyl-pentapeptide-transferase [Candidatus Chloroploca mongolica]